MKWENSKVRFSKSKLETDKIGVKKSEIKSINKINIVNIEFVKVLNILPP